MRHLAADLRFGFRLLLAAPITSLAAVLSLALGIGGTTAMFSVVDGVLLRPLPFPAPEELVMVSATAPDRPRVNMSPGDFVDVRNASSFVGMAALVQGPMSLVGGGRPEEVQVETVSANFFTLLGARPRLGRLFVPAEDAPGTEARVVLSEGLWQRRFGGRPDILGQVITLADRPVVVVGVAPEGFRFEQAADLWLLGDRGVPRFTTIPGDLTTNRDVHFLTVVGRLRPGVALQAAQAELDAKAAELARLHPRFNTGKGIRVDPLHAIVVGDSPRLLLLLFGAVALLLLIAAANVANLLVVRTQARALELTMRAALGAPRGRLAAQVLVESLLIAIVGGLLGIALAAWAVDAIVRLAPDGLPRIDEVGVNGRLLAFATLVTLTIGVAFGSWPAWRASRTSLATMLQGEARGTGTRERRRGQRLLVSVELALAQVLLVGACLLAASLVRLLAVDTGYDARGLVAVDVSLPATRYADPARKAAFHDAVLERLGRLPGVATVAMAMRAPMSPPIERGVWFEGRPDPAPGERQGMSYLTVSPGYFGATGLTVRRGRGITDEDRADAPGVVVVNEAFARRYFPGADPIGRRIGYGGGRDNPGYWRTIVGVVEDARDRPARPAEPTAYAPYRQDREFWNFASFLVKTARPADTIGEEVRRAVLEVDPDQPISRVRTIEGEMRSTVAVQRFATLLASLFAGLALLLAAIGTFGVMSHVVAGRTREIGVRLALGATTRDIVRLVLGQAARVALAAAAAGLAAAILLGRTLQTLLYEVQAGDPALLGLAAAALIAVALAASYIPVRRVLGRNPVASLQR